MVSNRRMAITLTTPTVDELGEAVGVIREWQLEGLPVQLHPGDFGWNWSTGVESFVGQTRMWSRDGQLVAIGMEDDNVLRLAIAPEADGDEGLAQQMLADMNDPERGVFTAGKAAVEARFGSALQSVLTTDGWEPGEPWTPLTRSLKEPVEDCGLRIETVGPDLVSVRTAVHRASFGSERFTDERWHKMAAGPAYADAKCLVAYDDQDNAVAATTVWSAGPGRTGLIEPLGAHPDFRGHGYGLAITIAAAATLQDMGSSSVRVCTPSANVIGVAAYVSAGFVRQPDSHDFDRLA